MGDLSEHFSASEFRCPCGQCEELPVNPELIRALESLRNWLCESPIRITSGVRCAAHNAAVGGAPSSQHLYGNAADITVAGAPPERVANVAWSLPEFRGVGKGETFTHVDVRPGQKVRWVYGPHNKPEPWPNGE